MCDPVTVGLFLGASTGTAAAVGTAAYIGAGSLGLQAYGASKAASAQKSASDQAAQAATKAADQSDQAFNKANGKQPNVAGMMADNQMAAKGGVSGTMLTGPQGVDPKTLLLGKTTLLGG